LISSLNHGEARKPISRSGRRVRLLLAEPDDDDLWTLILGDPEMGGELCANRLAPLKHGDRVGSLQGAPCST